MVIHPGKGVGGITFGATVDEVKAILGEPSSVRNSEGLCTLDYVDKEFGGAYFFADKLVTIIVAPTEDTILWDKPLYRMSEIELEGLLSSHGHAFTSIPRRHPAIFDQLDAPTAGLTFSLLENCCDDIVVGELRNVTWAPKDWVS